MAINEPEPLPAPVPPPVPVQALPISLEHARYAAWLTACTRFGSAVLYITFTAYVLGWLPAAVPLDQLPQLWRLPLADYLRATGTPTGWQWLTRMGQGDMLGLAGVAWLAGCSGLCLLAVLPLYARRGERAMAALCLGAVAVLVLAAGGWMTGGH